MDSPAAAFSVPGPENVRGEVRSTRPPQICRKLHADTEKLWTTHRIYLILILTRGSPFPMVKPKETSKLNVGHKKDHYL